jgi:hypothetical protein
MFDSPANGFKLVWVLFQYGTEEMLTCVLLNVVESSIPIHLQCDLLIYLYWFLGEVNVLQSSTLYVVYFDVINKAGIVGLTASLWEQD